jgi:hypothetical protein
VIVLTLAGGAAKLCAQDDSAVLGPLLEICDSSMTYRRLHFAKPRLVARDGPAHLERVESTFRRLSDRCAVRGDSASAGGSPVEFCGAGESSGKRFEGDAERSESGILRRA